MFVARLWLRLETRGSICYIAVVAELKFTLIVLSLIISLNLRHSDGTKIYLEEKKQPNVRSPRHARANPAKYFCFFPGCP